MRVHARVEIRIDLSTSDRNVKVSHQSPTLPPSLPFTHSTHPPLPHLYAPTVHSYSDGLYFYFSPLTFRPILFHIFRTLSHPPQPPPSPHPPTPHPPITPAPHPQPQPKIITQSILQRLRIARASRISITCSSPSTCKTIAPSPSWQAATAGPNKSTT